MTESETEAFLNLPVRVQGRRIRVYLRYTRRSRPLPLGAELSNARATVAVELDPASVEEVRTLAADKLSQIGTLHGRVVVLVERQDTAEPAKEYP